MIGFVATSGAPLGARSINHNDENLLKNMTRPTVFPIRGNHSVKNVVFVCELASNLRSDDLEKILEQYQGDEKLRSFLPVKLEQRGTVSITFQAGAATSHHPPEPPQQANDLVGLVFNRIGPDGVGEWGLAIQPNAILVSCNRYDRWKPAAETAIPLLLKILRIVPNAGIATVALQYTDEWTIAAASDVPIGSSLFKQDNEYIPARLLAQSGGWHCHSGWFDQPSEELPRNLVNVNVNVNVLPITNQSTVALNHAQRAMQPTPIFGVDEASTESSIRTQFLAMHAGNKQLLKDLLAEAIQEQIKLFATS